MCTSNSDFFQRAQCGKRPQEKLPSGETREEHFSQVTKVKLSRDKSHWHCVPFIWWDEHGFLSLGSSSQKAQNPSLILRGASDIQQLGNSLKNTWPLALKTFQVIRNQSSLRNFHHLDGTKETWQLNVIWYPRRYSRRENRHFVKNKENLDEVQTLVNHNVSALVH